MHLEPSFQFHPLTTERWDDLERLFGPRGGIGGCWCMSWRLKRPEFSAMQGEGNRQAFKTIVHTGPPPGLAPAFWKAGFVEVARRSEKRPIMRLYVE